MDLRSRAHNPAAASNVQRLKRGWRLSPHAVRATAHYDANGLGRNVTGTMARELSERIHCRYVRTAPLFKGDTGGRFFFDGDILFCRGQGRQR